MSNLPQTFDDLSSAFIALSITDNDTFGKPIQAEGKSSGVFHFETSFYDAYGNLIRYDLVLGDPELANFGNTFTLRVRTNRAEASFGFFRLANSQWMFAPNVTLPGTPVDRMCTEEFNIVINNAFSLWYSTMGVDIPAEFDSEFTTALSPPTLQKLNLISDLEKERQEKELQQQLLDQKLAQQEQARREKEAAELKAAREKEAAEKARLFAIAEQARIQREQAVAEQARIQAQAEQALIQREQNAIKFAENARAQEAARVNPVDNALVANKIMFFRVMAMNKVARDGRLADKNLPVSELNLISKFVAQHGRDVVAGWWTEYKSPKLDF
jgi:hypothetical protein